MVGLFRSADALGDHPSRFGAEPDAKAFRQHVTGGFDVKVFPWRVFGLFEEGTNWRISGSIDFAPRYSNYSLSVKQWF